jgi:hypothetical protein
MNFKGGKIKVICKICKKESKKFPSDLKNRRGKFCSKKCAGIWQSINRIGEKAPNFKHGEACKDKKHHCIDCNIELIDYHAKRCSSCAAKKRKGKLATHYIDGKTLKKYFCQDCRVEIGWKTATEGKNRCLSCAMKELFKDITNHPAYIDGSSYEKHSPEFTEKLKEQVHKRDNYECQNCGMTEEEHLIVVGRILDTHHIDHNKQNCKETNLITLCQQCNLRANKNRDYWIKIYKNKIKEIYDVKKM